MKKIQFISFLISLVFLTTGCQRLSKDNLQPILILGDSFTSLAGEKWPRFFRDMVTAPIVVEPMMSIALANAAVTGRGGLRHSPLAVIIYLGTWDLLWNNSASVTKERFINIINYFNSKNSVIFIVDMIGYDLMMKFWISRQAEDFQIQFLSLLSDYYAMFDQLKAENPDIIFIPNILDGVYGIHIVSGYPTLEGQQIMAETIFNTMYNFLEQNELIRND